MSMRQRVLDFYMKQRKRQLKRTRLRRAKILRKQRARIRRMKRVVEKEKQEFDERLQKMRNLLKKLIKKLHELRKKRKVAHWRKKWRLGSKGKKKILKTKVIEKIPLKAIIKVDQDLQSLRESFAAPLKYSGDRFKIKARARSRRKAEKLARSKKPKSKFGVIEKLKKYYSSIPKKVRIEKRTKPIVAGHSQNNRSLRSLPKVKKAKAKIKKTSHLNSRSFDSIIKTKKSSARIRKTKTLSKNLGMSKKFAGTIKKSKESSNTIGKIKNRTSTKSSDAVGKTKKSFARAPKIQKTFVLRKAKSSGLIGKSIRSSDAAEKSKRLVRPTGKTKRSTGPIGKTKRSSDTKTKTNVSRNKKSTNLISSIRRSLLLMAARDEQRDLENIREKLKNFAAKHGTANGLPTDFRAGGDIKASSPPDPVRINPYHIRPSQSLTLWNDGYRMEHKFDSKAYHQSVDTLGRPLLPVTSVSGAPDILDHVFRYSRGDILVDKLSTVSAPEEYMKQSKVEKPKSGSKKTNRVSEMPVSKSVELLQVPPEISLPKELKLRTISTCTAGSSKEDLISSHEENYQNIKETRNRSIWQDSYLINRSTQTTPTIDIYETNSLANSFILKSVEHSERLIKIPAENMLSKLPDAYNTGNWIRNVSSTGTSVDTLDSTNKRTMNMTMTELALFGKSAQIEEKLQFYKSIEQKEEEEQKRKSKKEEKEKRIERQTLKDHRFTEIKRRFYADYNKERPKPKKKKKKSRKISIRLPKKTAPKVTLYSYDEIVTLLEIARHESSKLQRQQEEIIRRSIQPRHRGSLDDLRIIELATNCRKQVQEFNKLQELQRAAELERFCGPNTLMNRTTLERSKSLISFLQPRTLRSTESQLDRTSSDMSIIKGSSKFADDTDTKSDLLRPKLLNYLYNNKSTPTILTDDSNSVDSNYILKLASKLRCGIACCNDETRKSLRNCGIHVTDDKIKLRCIDSDNSDSIDISL